ncbi:MAG: hypothetical protein H0W05_01450 [Thermoleophilaceae bacterium]|nr:hypothetical protein [Thermoleophilaceae bacterium]
MFVQSTSRVGAIAELEIATAAVRAGLTVLRPVAEQARYDLALEIGPRLFRVQCKSGALDQRAGVIKVGLQRTWYSPQGYVRTTYRPGKSTWSGSTAPRLIALTFFRPLWSRIGERSGYG